MKLLTIWRGLTVATIFIANTIIRLSLSKRMIMQLRSLLFLLVASIAFFSCETKVDLIAEGEESPIVFGFLDSKADTQFVKITKSFVTDGNAFQGALDPALSEYEDLEAWVIEYDGSDSVAAYLLQEIEITNKDSGLFYFPVQTVYFTDEITFEDNDPSFDNEFRLEFYGSDREVSSTTTIIGPFEPNFTQSLEDIRFVQNNDITNTIYQDKTMKIDQSPNAKRYEFTLRFHYNEIYNDGSEAERYMDFGYAPWITPDLTGNHSFSFKIKGEQFFQGVQSRLIVQNNEENVARRVIGKLEYIFDFAGSDLNTYIELNKPATSFNSEQNPYSNINNGVGVWSSRGQEIFYDKELEVKSIAELALGQYTGSFKFCSDKAGHNGLPFGCN